MDSDSETVTADEIDELAAFLTYQESTLPDWIAESAGISSDDGVIRAMAAHVLAAVARDRPDAVTPAVDSLRQSLSDTDSGLRSNAALALAAVAEERPDLVRPAVMDLQTLLDDERRTTRSAAALALKNVASESPEPVTSAIDELCGLLDAEKAKTRGAAAGALAHVATDYPGAIESTVGDLRRLLDDGDADVRNAAKRALAALDCSPATSDRRTQPSNTATSSKRRSDSRQNRNQRSVSINPSSLAHEDVIGRTATTVVHEAKRTDDERTRLAVKHPARHGTLADETIDRFQQEARQWASLDDHANIVSVIDWGYDSLPWIRGEAPVPWIAMEAMTGPAFQTVAEHATFDQSLWTARRIVDAVWHAHQRGVVHLDLKPSNVLFADRKTDQRPTPRIADWEVSQSLLDSTDEIGITTPGYFAPEQERHETTDHRTDQFQLGIVLYELFTGTHPFVDDFNSAPEQERIAGVLEGNYTPPSQTRSEIPAALDDVFERALAPDHGDRYEATIDLRRGLERIEHDEGSPQVRSEGDVSGSTTINRPSDHDTHRSDSASTTGTAQSESMIADTDWPTFQGDVSRTGHRPDVTGPSPPVAPRWTFETGDSINSGPTVVDDTLYVGSDDMTISAVDTTMGEERWRYTTDNPVRSSPTVAGDTVYAGSHDNCVYALETATGRVRWQTETDGKVYSPPAVVDKTVYVGSFDNHVYALEATTGRERWSYQTDSAVGAAPTVADGTVYVSCGSGILYALTADTGETLWQYPSGGPAMAAPAVYDGALYTATNDGTVVALDTDTGNVNWTFGGGGNAVSPPALYRDTVFIGSTDGTVFALDADNGTERWYYETKGRINSAPVVSDETLYVGGTDGSLYALEVDTGAEQWSYETNSLIASSPAVADGTVYVGDHDGVLYALSGD